MVEAVKMDRATWSGKWAFILAAAASAVGLGNMWRFPYLAARFGGGTFLITYLVLVLTFGISLLLLETALGRNTRLSVIGAYRHFGAKFSFIGILAAAVPFIITPYYCIIGGWVTKYMVGYITNGPAALADGGTFFANFITSDVESYIWMFLFMILTFIVVGMGVQKGIEKANLVMMPALIIMAAAIAIFTLTLPGALEGAAYYLIPDFSKFSAELVINALGQMFYSLSLAMGIMVTYGSYMRRADSLTQSVTRIAGFDFGVSFLAGLMIVPAAFVAMGSAELVAEKSGPSLMFVILPEVFNTMDPLLATIIGTLFFLLVLFAALTSSISLTEALVSIVADGTHLPRRISFFIVIVFTVAVGCVINAGYNSLAFIEPLGSGSSILDFFDFISNSVLMPIVAILTCVFVGWLIKPAVLVNEIKESSPFVAEKLWIIMIKYIAPILVATILIWNVLPYLIR
jgi:NSS family neurotransmitter:Na+ symporter